ncbi:MAG: CopG family transcriptional regulator [Candidatus Aenigmatarchaeota archaeon]
MGPKTSIRFNKELLEDIDKRADDLGLSRSEYLREVAKRDVYGSDFSDLPSEESSSEKSYEIRIEVGGYEIYIGGQGFDSQEELEEDRSKAVEDVVKCYKEIKD